MLHVDDVDKCGIDISEKLYLFESADGNLGLCAKVSDEGDVEDWLASYRSTYWRKRTWLHSAHSTSNGIRVNTLHVPGTDAVEPTALILVSIHNCGLAADLNSPEHTTLDTGFADTAAFRWLCENAEQYGFILRYPKEAESVTGITYEPWHWRYVGPENAALLNQSGLCLDDAVAVLQRIAAGEAVTG